MKSRHFQAVFFFTTLLFFSIFIPMGNIPSDTQYSVQTAVSICNGRLNIDPSLQLQNLKIGRSGNYYSQYGIGYALLFVPAACTAKLLSPILPYDYILTGLVSCTNTILASAVLLLLFRLFIQLGYSKKITLLSTLFIATGSILLPYSKINHAEIPTLLIIILFILRFKSAEILSCSNGVAFGTMAAVTLLLKIGNIVYCLCIIGAGLLYLVKRSFKISGLLALTGIPVFTIISLLIFNKYRFLSYSDFGYGAEQSMFTMLFLDGLKMLFFSPSKSMFLFSPLVIVSCAGMVMSFKKIPRLVIVTAAMASGNIIFYSLWHDWHGGWSWGPRLLVPSIILLHIFLPEFVVQMKSKKVRAAFFSILLLLSVLVNILGSCVWYQQIYYFHRDYVSYKSSHINIAAKLFFHKLHSKDEVYSCRYMNIDCNYSYFKNTWNNLSDDDRIDFRSFETFQGFSVFWSSIGRNFNIPFLWLIPVVFIVSVISGTVFLWRIPLKTASKKLTKNKTYEL